MSSAVSHALILNRVRIAIDQSVTPAQKQQWQRQVSQTLSQVSLRPQMPPQAILVVRKLPDPKPTSLLSNHRWRGLRDWEQAAQNALNDCWRTAIRPARSPVPSTANSVWFVDPAEWLVCFSWDTYRGVAGDRWWWQAALPHPVHHSPVEAVFQLWQESAQWLPAALNLLIYPIHSSVDRSSITALLAEFTPSQSRQLLEQVIEIYQFPLPLSPSALIPALSPYLAPATCNLIQPLPPETQALVAVCLTLPNTVQLLQASLALTTQTALPVTPDVESSEVTESPQQPGAESSLPVIAPESVSSEGSANNGSMRSLNTLKIIAIQSTSLELSPIPTTPSTTDFAQEDDPSPHPAGEAHPSDVSGFTPVPSADSSIPLPFLSAIDLNLVNAEQGIQTGVGGLWYLVNVLVELNWIGRSPLLTPWHQLSALAQALLPEIPLDPVWGLLAEIAGDPLPPAVTAQWQEDRREPMQRYLAERLDQPDAIAQYLLEPATLYLTRTHVDVVFTLDQIRLDVRMAGLDRDPGWVPELARAIAFHYE